MKKILPLCLLLLFAGCTPAMQSPAEKWVAAAYENSGTAREACQMLRPQYNLLQRGLRVTDFLQNVSLRDACQEYVASLQEYAKESFVGSATLEYTPGRSLSLVCLRENETYTVAPIWIRSNGQDVEAIEIYPEQLSPSWGSSAQIENTLERVRPALPEPCQKISI